MIFHPEPLKETFSFQGARTPGWWESKPAAQACWWPPAQQGLACPASCPSMPSPAPATCDAICASSSIWAPPSETSRGQGTGHRYRTTGKARWHCGRRYTSLILSFRQLLSPARDGRLQQRVEYKLDRLVMISVLISTFVFVDHRLANMRALR